MMTQPELTKPRLPTPAAPVTADAPETLTIRTHCGLMLDLLRPDPDQINIQDIAIGLSRLYAGGPQARDYHPLTYAQAAHELSCMVPPAQAKKALLAFAPVAYLPELAGSTAAWLLLPRRFARPATVSAAHPGTPLHLLAQGLLAAIAAAFPPCEFTEREVADIWQRSPVALDRPKGEAVWEPTRAYEHFLHRFDELLHADISREVI